MPRASTRRLRLRPFFPPIRRVGAHALPRQRRFARGPIHALPAPRDALHLVVLGQTGPPYLEKKAFPLPALEIRAPHWRCRTPSAAPSTDSQSEVAAHIARLYPLQQAPCGTVLCPASCDAYASAACSRATVSIIGRIMLQDAEAKGVPIWTSVVWR
jgi:hypothetical protein